ncbi:MAG: YeeE/YedE family protein [Burkholderiales bacterium]|nr:YeeE/YedE family protein [Burkholderiales bacterium]
MPVDTLNWLVPLAGAVLGAVFGAITQRTGLCSMGGIADAVGFGDTQRLRTWGVATAVAVLGTQALAATRGVDLGASLYTGARWTWLSHALGGAAFGVGMTLASGCGSRNAVRLGAGSLKALVVLLVLGLSAWMTLKGALAPLRVHGLDTVAVELGRAQDLPTLFAGAAGPPSVAWRLGLAVAFGGGLLALCLGTRIHRPPTGHLVGAAIVGLVIAGGWWVTGDLGFVAEHPDTLAPAWVATQSHRPESFTFVAPVVGGLELALLWTDASLHPTFGVATLVGTVAGAAVMARVDGSFHWQGFADAGDLARHLAGGALMGFGGVCALGCTTGQGLAGLSTLALGAFETVAAIAVGCVVTLKAIERGAFGH